MTKHDIKEWGENYSGWVLITVFTLIPIFIWVSINDLSVMFSSSYIIFSTLGKIFGLSGFMLYAINLLLAIRHPWLERFFGGLNRVYIAHHITGAIALAMVAFHPMFLAIRIIEIEVLSTFADAARFLWPRVIDTSLAYEEVREAVSINAGIVSFWGMVVLLILTLFVKLPYRIWLFTHRFLGAAFVFALLHIVTIYSDTSESALLLWYLLVWGIIGLAAYCYRTLFGSVFVRKMPYTVQHVKHENNVTLIELSPLKQRLDFKPGQFIFIRFLWSQKDGVSTECHPFTIASGPKDDQLKLYVKALGDYTANLKGLKKGTVAEIEGAFGRFTPARYSSKSQVWIAGGIGITPFLSMTKSLHQLPENIHLIYCTNERNELVERDILAEKLPKNYKNFTFIPYVNSEHKGNHVTAEYIAKHTKGFTDKEIFICGPAPMMKSLRKQLRTMGVKKSSIHTEEFTMS